MRLFAFLLSLLSFVSGANADGVRRILFVGNSITLHRPAPDIGWTGNWGMAATAPENDYVHLVVAGISKRTGAKPESKVVNLADFERRFESYDLDAGLRDEVAFGADTVVVALGENVPALEGADHAAKFKASVIRLLKRLDAGRGAKIYVRSCFWPDAEKDRALREACAEVGGVFVDIGALGKEERNFARSERKIDHVGVAGHPGDAGMKAIANAILDAMEKSAR